MNRTIILLLLTWLFYAGVLTTATIEINKIKKCLYKHTVNLTNHQRFENGTYVYKGILIPPESQTLYDTHFFLGNKKSVPEHVRGCVCDQHPCVKLCCAENEYFNETSEKCEKLMTNIKVLWEILIETYIGKYKNVNILKDFTTVKYDNCWGPKTLTKIAGNWTFSQDGLLRTNDGILDISEFCFSPSLMGNIQIYILEPYTCRLLDDGSRKQMIHEYSLYVSVFFQIPTLLLYIVLQELRKSLAGKIFFCYLFSMTMGNVIFCFLIIFRLLFNAIVLLILGFIGYIFLILAILWLSVICYHIWQNFKNNNKIVANKNQQFIIYSLYVGLCACLASGYIVYMKLPWIWDKSNVSSVAEISWWTSEKWSAFHFYGATVLILLFNCYKFVRLTIAICKERCDMDKLTHNKELLRKNAFIVLRLCLITDMHWFLKIISHYSFGWDFLYLLVNSADGIQGFMIFCLFVLRQKTWRILKQKKSYNVRIPQENCIDFGTAVEFENDI